MNLENKLARFELEDALYLHFWSPEEARIELIQITRRVVKEPTCEQKKQKDSPEASKGI